MSASGYPTIPVLNTTSPEMAVSAPKEWPVMGSDPSARYSTALSPCGWIGEWIDGWMIVFVWMFVCVSFRK